MEKLYVYIAGPLHSSGQAQINVRDACFEADALRAGNPNVVPIVPHLMMHWDAMWPKNTEYWLAIDKDLLMKCDALLRFGGHSVHGDLEVKWAEEAGIPVFRSTGALVMSYERGVLKPRSPKREITMEEVIEFLSGFKRLGEVAEGVKLTDFVSQEKLDALIDDSASPVPEKQLPLTLDPTEAEKEAVRVKFRYKVDQQVKSLSGRGGYGVGVIKGTRIEAGKPYYNCNFGAFTGWVPEGDIDPIIMGADFSVDGDSSVAVITVMSKQKGGEYVQVKMSLAEGDECMLAANPYRTEQRVRLTKIESAEQFRVEGLENGKTYKVTSHELRPIPDDTTSVAGGDGA